MILTIPQDVLYRRLRLEIKDRLNKLYCSITSSQSKKSSCLKVIKLKRISFFLLTCSCKEKPIADRNATNMHSESYLCKHPLLIIILESITEWECISAETLLFTLLLIQSHTVINSTLVYIFITKQFIYKTVCK